MSDLELRQSIDSWFARYDDFSKKGDVEAMAEMAMFPIHVITDDSAGNGYAGNWTREQFVRMMSEAMRGAPADLEMKTERIPFFLTKDLAAVMTNAAVTGGGQTHELCYADILVKDGGSWKFQTIVQGGWGNLLKSQNSK